MDRPRGLLSKAETAQRVCLGLLSLVRRLVESLVWEGVEKEEEEEAGQRRRLLVTLTWPWTQLQRIGAPGVWGIGEMEPGVSRLRLVLV